MNIKIIEATKDDIPFMVELIHASIKSLCVKDHKNSAKEISSWLSNKNQNSFENWISDLDRKLFCAKLDDMIVSIGMVAITDRKLLLLYNHPDYVGLNIGKKMLRHCEMQLFKTGAVEIHLESTQTALEFYLANGWKKATYSETELNLFKRKARDSNEDF